MKKIKLGIIGFGNMGTSHAKRIINGECPDFELVAIADINPERLKWCKENFGEKIARFNTAEEMLSADIIDACLISVPHYDHPKYAIMCLERNIHVMVEKPVGVYTKQVREMNEAADKSNAVFGVMFNQRTNHIYRKMRELVQSGKYGEIRRTNWIITNWYRPQAYFDSGEWRATWSGEGGGVLLNQCPHQLDLWQWICGMPKKVEAHLLYGKWHDIEVEDDVTAYAEYENGATGVFITSTGDPCGTNRFEVQMDRAKIIAENDKLELFELETAEPEFSKTNKSPFGQIESRYIEVETDGKNEQHTGVINAWGRAILYGEPLIADAREGINGLMLSNAMHLSSFLGKEVEIPIDEELYFEELMKKVKTSRKKTNVNSVVADTSETYGGTTAEKNKHWNTNW
ncbi:MAG: Gfo/Idh/MocA family oxidoreductase [Eubacterium sp.]|nr:Gfo/Idh/MocA family oxidoreductase [Eubacterium sp.]